MSSRDDPSGVPPDRAGPDGLDPAASLPQTLYQDLVETAQDLIWRTDDAGRFVFLNPEWERVFGYRVGDMLGCPFSEFQSPEQAERDRREFARVLSGDPVRGYETVYLRSSGEEVVLSFNAKVVRDAQGRVIGAGGTARDITMQRRAEAALRERDAQLVEAQEVARLGFYLFDIEHNVWSSSAVLDEIFGIGPGYPRSLDSWTGIVHPEDREAMRAYVTDEVIGRGVTFDREYRILRPADGDVRWVHGLGRLQLGNAGRPVAMFGTIQDVTARHLAEEALRRSEERYRLLVTQAAEGIVIAEPGSLKIQEANRAACLVLGAEEAELEGRSLFELMADEAAREDLACRTAGLQESGRMFLGDYALVRSDGSPVDVALRMSLVKGAGSPLVMAALQDVTESRRAAALQAALYRIAEETASSQDVESFYEAAHRIVGELMYARNFYVALRDPASGEITFPYFVDEIDPEPPARGTVLERGMTAYVMRTGQAVLATPEVFERLVADGEVDRIGGHSVDWMGVPLRIGGSISGVLVVQSYGERHRYTQRECEVLTFVSQHIATAIERKRAEETIRHQAYHDTLTQLPNRLLFRDRLSQALNRAERRNERLAVCFLDLDRFKTINDTLGHALGDQILKEVARRLSAAVRDGDTVARLGGDEFMVLLVDLRHAEDMARIAEKLLQAVRPAIELEGHVLHVTTSIGISACPGDGRDAETLIRLADIALYRAKDRGRDTYQLYNPAMNLRSIELLAFENRLRGALDRGEFTLHYQPQVEIATGRVVGVESLVRWKGADERLVMPDDFIALSEETGVIIPLGDWVLRSACRQARAWEREGLGPLRVAVNLSFRQFQRKNLPQLVEAALHESGLWPGLLELELTESVIMKDAEAVAETLAELRKLGVRIAIDDFGTGYSSLSNLRQFPIQVLKIDRSFVRDCTTSPDAAAIVATIVSMAHTLRLDVIAEGVETTAQLEFLRAHGCEVAQGFYFGAPDEPADIAALLSKGLSVPLPSRRSPGQQDAGN